MQPDMIGLPVSVVVGQNRVAVERWKQRMSDQILGHQGMVSLVPIVQEQISGGIKIECQSAHDHQGHRVTILFLQLEAPGKEVACCGQGNGNQAEY